jgi:hypothetical protein
MEDYRSDETNRKAWESVINPTTFPMHGIELVPRP